MKCPQCGKEIKEHHAGPIPEGYEECSYCSALIKKKSNKEEVESMTTVLPKYKGYTVDFRLGEFRRVSGKGQNMRIDFFPFKSEIGDILLGDLIEGKGGEKLKKEAMDYMMLHS